jgi:hypothetical protein
MHGEARPQVAQGHMQAAQQMHIGLEDAYVHHSSRDTFVHHKQGMHLYSSKLTSKAASSSTVHSPGYAYVHHRPRDTNIHQNPPPKLPAHPRLCPGCQAQPSTEQHLPYAAATAPGAMLGHVAVPLLKGGYDYRLNMWLHWCCHRKAGVMTCMLCPAAAAMRGTAAQRPPADSQAGNRVH